MAMTAANSMPIQTQQVQGDHQMQRPSALMLMRKTGKKKPMPEPKQEQKPSGPPTANILMRGRK